MILIDTSALLAILDRDQDNHETAAKCWFDLLDKGQDLLITSYIQLETCALVQNRLGIEALRGYHQNLAPLLKIRVVNVWKIIIKRWRPCWLSTTENSAW